ncbi:TetR/AcrR family transcriptional regulator [Candidatus Izimaplasma bacterium HR1]|uniref:TetR/AcrR family transcriptional regulator n=1 Tax=Candidatus Izimoplasma sp. HR1 TaxID=1541959 RepID=UPI000571EF4B
MPRALTEDEKRLKELSIIGKAFELFEGKSFRAFRMDDLAKLCKMSKGIVFKYFESKEMLFLKMLEIEYEKLFQDLDKKIIKHNEMTKDEFREFMINYFKRMLNHRIPFMRLLKIKSTILDENQTYNFALRNNQKIHDMYYELSQNLMFKVKGVSLNQISTLLAYQNMVIVGYLNTFVNEGIVKNVIEDANLELFTVDQRQLAIEAFTLYINQM